MLQDHQAEISSVQFEFTGEYAVTGSIDRTCKIWDVGSGEVVHTLTGHTDEVLDVNFNALGTKLVTASADSTARVYSSMTGTCIGVLDGTPLSPP